MTPLNDENQPRKRDGKHQEEYFIEDKMIESQSDKALGGDAWNIAVLLFLYLLQGIPLGLTASIPMILQNRGVSYKEQAEFSFVYWPFSLKLIWAPIVDSCFITWFGRRKTWLIPTQYLLGLFMLLLSVIVNDLLGTEKFVDLPEGNQKVVFDKPNVMMLTAIFFILNFFAATQDIVVDGWALTMLKRRNVGHASTCNSVGQTAGYFLGYVVFMALESAEFCNTYLRSEQSPKGIVTLAGFLYFWGFVFLVTTTLLALFKHESTNGNNGVAEPDFGITQTYSILWKIVRLPNIKRTILILLTVKIGFSACDAVTSLKLVEGGIPKEKLGMLAVPLVPLQIVLPLVISKYTAGPRPMDLYLKAIPYRLLFGLIAAFIVWVTPSFIVNGEVSYIYYVLLIGSYSVHQVAVYSMFVAIMAFFARISDPAVGGTYMTLLNTLSNLGGNWPTTVALWFVDSLTWKSCLGGTISNLCGNHDDVASCTKGGGRCVTDIDGYYIESILCVVVGFVWLLWGKTVIKKLQSADESAWKVSLRKLS